MINRICSVCMLLGLLAVSIADPLLNLRVVDSAAALTPLPKLHTSGITILDGYNNTVYLRGTEVDANELYKHDNEYSGDYWFNATDVQVIALQGINVIELHELYWKTLMPTQDVVDTAWLNSHMDRWLSYTTANHIYAIVDLGNLGQMGSYTVPSWAYTESSYNQFEIDFWNTSDTAENSVRAAYVDLWTTLATRYADNPYVMYSINNEPFCANSLVNAGDNVALSKDYASFCTTLIDTIQNISSSIVFVNKPYNLNPDYYKINRNNIVWEDHLYVSSSYSLSQWDKQMTIYNSQYTVTFGKPFFIGEYSFIDDSSQYVNDSFPNWKSVLGNMTFYIENNLTACGRSWHEYPFLYGEWYSHAANATLFTSSESDWLLHMIGSSFQPSKATLTDLVAMAKAYNSTPNSPNWNPASDLNGDGIVNLTDLAILARRFK